MTQQLIITQGKGTNVVIKEAIILFFKQKWIVISAIYAFLLYTTWAQNDYLLFNEVQVTSIAAITLLLLISVALIWFRLKKHTRHIKVTYTLNTDTFSAVGPKHSATFKWEDIYMIREKKYCYLIYYTKNAPSLIDKTQLDHKQKEALDELISFVKNKINNGFKSSKL